MCYFLSIGIAAKHSDWVRESLSRGFEVRKEENRSFRSRLGPNAVAYTVTTMGSPTGCSCTLYSDFDVSEWTEQERTRRRKKGWSESKINRCLDQQLEHVEAGLDSSLIQDLSALFTRIWKLTLAVHWYDEDFETEYVNFIEETDLSINDLVDNPAILRPDIIYRMHR